MQGDHLAVRLVSRTRPVVRRLRRWLLPTAPRLLADVAVFMVMGIVAAWATDRRYVALATVVYMVSLVFLAPVVVSGWWLVIRAAVVDPLRGYLVRRATGEAVHFHDGVMRPSVNRRSQREVSETPDNRRHQPTTAEAREPP